MSAMNPATLPIGPAWERRMRRDLHLHPNVAVSAAPVTQQLQWSADLQTTQRWSREART